LLGLLQPETEFHILGTQPLVLSVDVFGRFRAHHLFSCRFDPARN